MFERFTDRARRVLVLAQEEARLLNHSFLGTEHLLLGLLAEGDGIAANALQQLDITLEATRERIIESVGLAGGTPSGPPPFTPRAKKVLELSLREALQLGHNYIGTEHLLLGLVDEGEGVGPQILTTFGAEPQLVREKVFELLGLPPSQAPVSRTRAVDISRFRIQHSEEATLVACSFCGRRPPASGQLIQGGRGFICEHCVREWAERLDAPPEPPADPPAAKFYEPPEEPSSGEV